MTINVDGLVINVNSDPRNLFTEYNVETIKKIRKRIIDEIEDKKESLRNFIGNNYKPLLNTPPILRDIQNIVENCGEKLKKVSFDISSKQDDSLILNSRISPFSLVSQLYMESLKALDASEFILCLEHYQRAKQVLDAYQKKDCFTYRSLELSIDRIPRRTVDAIDKYLSCPQNNLTSDLFTKCFSSMKKLKTIDDLFPKPLDFLKQSLSKRFDMYITTEKRVFAYCNTFISLTELLLSSSFGIDTDYLLKTDILSFVNSWFCKYRVENFEEEKITDIIKHASLIKDTIATKLDQLFTIIKIPNKQWSSYYINIFKDFISRSIYLILNKLNFASSAMKIIKEEGNVKFSASEFLLNSTEDLSIRSFGVHPSVSKLRLQLIEAIKSISSSISLDSLGIVNQETLRKSVSEIIRNTIKSLEPCSKSYPLLVTYLCSIFISKQITDLYNSNKDPVLEQLNGLINSSMTSISRERLQNMECFSFLLDKGSAFEVLFALESDIYSVCGNTDLLQYSGILRGEAKKVVVNNILSKLEASLDAKEDTYITYFREYIILKKALRIEDNLNIMSIFSKKINNSNIRTLTLNLEHEVDRIISNSRNLIRNILC